MIKQFFINPYSFKPEIFASVGTSTSPTSTGTKAVTGVGFQPKAVLPFGGVNNGSTGNDALLAFGVGTSPSSRAAISVSSQHNVATSNSDRRHTNVNIYSALNSLGSTFEEADLDSLDPDGFTLDFATTAGSTRILNHICLGGADLEVSLTQHQTNNTNAPQSFAHGLSGAPTGLLFFSIQYIGAPPVTIGSCVFNIGFWSQSNQISAYLLSLDGLASTSTKRSLRNDCVQIQHDQAGVPLRGFSIDSVDSTNANAVYDFTADSQQRYFFMLAVRGAKCQVGTFDCNGSLDPLTISTPGIVPKLFLPVMTAFGVDNINSVQNTAALMIGASDGANNVSCGITDQNGVTTTNARRYQSSNSLVEYNDTGTKVFEATASFDGENVIVNPSTNLVTTWGQGAYLVIGS
jgi:hypothetical protein